MIVVIVSTLRITNIQIFILRKDIQNITKTIYKDLQYLLKAVTYNLYKEDNQIKSIEDRFAPSKRRRTRS